MNTDAVPAPAANELSETQLEDLGLILSQYIPRPNMVELIRTIMGPEGLQRVGNEIGNLDLFFQSAVREFHNVGLIPELVAAVRRESRFGPLQLALNHILNGHRLNSPETLQKFVNENEPFFSSAAILELLPKVLRVVCAVALGAPVNRIRGTGFLIAPDLVLTNYHVVEEFLDLDPVSKVITPKGLGKDLFFFFDYLWDPPPVHPFETGRHSSLRVNAAEDWLVFARKSLPGDGSATPPEVVTTEYDYAVIRLSARVGSQASRAGGGFRRGWLKLREEIDATLDRRILVFQHPGAFPQRWDVGAFRRFDPSRTRAWYRVSAAKGSSGGAAVDMDGKLFALHNAEVNATEVVTAGELLNQGVRIDFIQKDLMDHCPAVAESSDPLEDDAGFWSLNDDRKKSQPVIGRTAFRELVSKISSDKQSAKRVLMVSGPTGSGRKFSIPLLRRILGSRIPVVSFSAVDLESLSPRDFLRTLAQDLGIRTAIPIPEPPATENLARWLRLDLPKWLLDRLIEHQQLVLAEFQGWIVLNCVKPEGRRMLWANNLLDFVACLMGAQDPGQQVVPLVQLRWLILVDSSENLPLQGIEKLEENLTDESLLDKDFADCVKSAWKAIDKDALIPDLLLVQMAQFVKSRLPAGKPIRAELAECVRTLVEKDPS